MLIETYAAFNPHATFVLTVSGEATTYPATMPAWTKWLPSHPTSPLWYEPEHFTSLVAAYLNRERAGGRAMTLREFVSEFHGLTGSAKPKAVLEAAMIAGKYLRDLAVDDAILEDDLVRLLTSMQSHARLVKPQALGIFGRDHLARVLCEYHHVAAHTIAYKKVCGEIARVPFMLEVAFGWRAMSDHGRLVITGINWAATPTQLFERLRDYLGTARAEPQHSIVVLVHLAMPRPTFRDRGKQALALPRELEMALRTSVEHVTRLWTAAVRRADRSHRANARAEDELRKWRRAQYPSVKEAAYDVMERAYLAASGQGRYVAHARQIMYAARRQILEMIHPDKAAKGLNDHYFTQILLPNFMLEHPELTSTWDVVFDDRGHFREPHRQNGRECMIGLGTLAVRNYLASWTTQIQEAIPSLSLPFDVETKGPGNRYQSGLFVEKEGFDELIQQAQMAERFDIAPMSTKGMSNTAARRLVDELSAHGVTIYVLHDFDKSGFTILRTLRTDTRRYRFNAMPNVIDLGLTLADVQAMALQSEPVTYRHDVDPKVELARCGATPQEQAFLVGERRYNPSTEKYYWSGQRVELNAITSDQFVEWLERRLTEHGVAKVIPTPGALASAYKLAMRTKAVNAQLEHLHGVIEQDTLAVPDDLALRVHGALQENPALSWDQALWKVVNGHEGHH